MKMLVTDVLRPDSKDIESLQSCGFDVVLHGNDLDDVKDPEQYTAVICGARFFEFHDISRFEKLKYIQLMSAGMDRVPMDYVRAHGIEIHNVGDVYSVPMAEFILCGILQLYKHFDFFRQNQNAHCWKRSYEVTELCGKRACILGTGNVGCQAAIRLKAFGCTVIGVNRTPREIEGFDEIVPLSSFKEEAKKCDILIVSIAAANNTIGMVDKDIFAKMKPGAVLINVARGALVDESALLEWLDTPGSGGALIDVSNKEPLPENSPLWDKEKLILTPHNSFIGDNNHVKLMKMTIKNLMKSNVTA